jgi:chromosomal replication initiator protein
MREREQLGDLQAGISAKAPPARAQANGARSAIAVAASGLGSPVQAPSTLSGAADFWAGAAALVRDRVGEENFRRWIDPLAVRVDRRSIEIEARDRQGSLALERHFLRGICDALREVGFTGSVELRGSSSTPGSPPARPALADDPSDDASRASREDRFPLNPAYTFERFVVGESNRFAHQAARVVADLPGQAHNPLYLHGGVGLGKTHLATAIAHSVRARFGPEAAVALSAERFIASSADARHNRATWLADRLRSARLVVLDDVQLLARDACAEEEFFRVFDELLASKRQLVLTCDLPPPAIPSLALRLKSRFEVGLATEIRPPDAQLRREIVRHKASLVGATIAPEVATFIALAEESGNVRALEGAFNRVRQLAEMTQRELSLIVARQALATAHVAAVSPSLHAIAETVARGFGMTAQALCTRRRRDRQATLARQVAVLIARRHSGRTLTEIASAFGFREHSVAAHASATARDRLAADPELAARVAGLERRLGRTSGAQSERCAVPQAAPRGFAAGPARIERIRTTS